MALRLGRLFYFPRKKRLLMGWDPRIERDACGIGFVADAEGRASRGMVETAIGALCNVRHRGAVASDAKTGDGAGLLVPISGPFFAPEPTRLGLPEDDPPWTGVGMAFVMHHTSEH